MKHYLAIDIGASSGRHIVGWREGENLKTKEVHRFPNGVKEGNGHLMWDLERLLREVRAGIDAALGQFGSVESLSIDTWGVDYVLLRGETEVLPAYAYRDSRTQPVIPEVHEKMPFSELYRRTGCQFQPFNSVYQLYDDQKRGRLEGVTDFLMIPEYLMWKLTGVKEKEFTNATTTGLVDARTREFSRDIIGALRLPGELFPPLSQPGTVVGEYRGIKVVLCATHDTASAVEGIPMEGNQLYLSSGTWSLLGVKTSEPLTDPASQAANYSNEGGVGYTRYQKNIMGMWLVNELRRHLCPDMPFPELVEAAEKSKCDILVDADGAEFLAPENMKEAFDRATRNGLKSVGDYFRCAYRSLAASYGRAVEELEGNTRRRYDKLYIVGGGAKNAFLNRLTQETTGKQVVALPIEATALGNLKIQMEGTP